MHEDHTHTHTHLHYIYFPHIYTKTHNPSYIYTQPFSHSYSFRNTHTHTQAFSLCSPCHSRKQHSNPTHYSGVRSKSLLMGKLWLKEENYPRWHLERRRFNFSPLISRSGVLHTCHGRSVLSGSQSNALVTAAFATGQSVATG